MADVARVVVTGPPASGKSTIATRAAELLRERGEPVYGFTTAEIRRGGRRTGFTVAGVASGLERVLAVRAVPDPVDGPRAGGPRGGSRVGSYVVDVEAFEEIALIEVENGLELDATLVVDEVGKMELLSPSFRALLDQLVHAPRLLATAQARPDATTQGFLDRIDARRIGLPRSDRAELAAIAVSWILETTRVS
jgi:nucleoside-triphosphatase